MGLGGHSAGSAWAQLPADFHVFGKQMDRAEDLTQAEIEGRRKIYAFAALLTDIGIAALCSQIGIRETVHYETRFRANERDLLLGTGYDDTVMRGSYRVDIHHHQDHGITFKYLDGRKEVCYGKANRTVLRQLAGGRGHHRALCRPLSDPLWDPGPGTGGESHPRWADAERGRGCFRRAAGHGEPEPAGRGCGRGCLAGPTGE